MYGLANVLKLPLPYAVGIMEMLWHFAGQNTPEGDIGRVTDAEIAAAVAWEKRPDILIEALVSSKWIDRHAEHRLIIHDWPEHADQAVRKTLQYRRSNFCTAYTENSPEVSPDKHPEVSPDSSPTSDTAKATAKAFEVETSEKEKSSTRARGQTTALVVSRDFHMDKFRDIIGVFVGLGRGLTERDLAICEMHWKALSIEDMFAAHSFAMRMIEEWKLRPTNMIPQPWNFFSEKHWRRESPRVLGTSEGRKESKSERAQRIANEQFSALQRGNDDVF